MTAGFPELASLPYFDFGGRSLLNRTADGAFRFSHYSIQEFLVVHALETDTTRLPPASLRVTNEMLAFLALLPQMPDLGRLDLTGLQPHALADFGFQGLFGDTEREAPTPGDHQPSLRAGAVSGPSRNTIGPSRPRDAKHQTMRAGPRPPADDQ